MECHRRRFFLASLGLALFATGCGSQVHPDAKLLVGKWQLLGGEQLEARISQNKTDSHTEPSKDNPNPRMELSFEADGSLQTRTRIGSIDSTKSGTWRLLQVAPGKEKLLIECQLQGQTTTHEIECVDGQTILLIPPNLAGLSNELTFRRTE